MPNFVSKAALAVANKNDRGCEQLAVLACIYRETDRQLDSYARAVRECKAVNEAANFCRWLQFSGVFKLLEIERDLLKGYAPALDVALLRRKLTDIVLECGELFRCGKANPRYCQTDIAEINRKLDVILSGVPSPDCVFRAKLDSVPI